MGWMLAVSQGRAKQEWLLSSEATGVYVEFSLYFIWGAKLRVWQGPCDQIGFKTCLGHLVTIIITTVLLTV